MNERAMTEPSDIEVALEDEIRQILANADDTLSVAEIYARSALAEGRHSVAARLASMAKRGLVVSYPCANGRCYRLPVLAQGAPSVTPKTIKGRVHAHLVKMGKPLSLRQIAHNLQLDRKAATRALNALGRDGLVDKMRLDGHGRCAWSVVPATAPAAEQAPPTLSDVLSNLRESLGFLPGGTLPEADEEPRFALASDGTLTLCVSEIELALDSEQTEALLTYLAPFVLHRQAQRSAA